MKITKTQLKEIIEEELEAALSEDELEEGNLAALNLLRRVQKKRQRGPGASSVDTHKRALAAKEKKQAQRDKERKDKEERERKEYDRRWRASLSPEDLAAEEEAEAYRQSFMMEGLSKAKLKQMIKEELEVTLTNEEAGDLFGEELEQKLDELDAESEQLDEADVSDLQIIAQAFAQIGLNLSPAILGVIMKYALERAMKKPETAAPLNEDGHSDIPSACRKLKTSIEDAAEMIKTLEAMDQDADLPSWWMSKITLAANYLNKTRDYLLY